MRTTRLALLTGAAAIILAGYAGIAQAKSPETHVLTLRLPDGQTEQVRYVGNVPPTVILAPDAMASWSEPANPFAMLDQISAQMDRQAQTLLSEIDAMGAPQLTGFASIPAMAGPGVCMRSVEITYTGGGAAPHVVSHSAGDCGATGEGATPATVPNAVPAKPGPEVIQAKAPSPRRGLLHMVSDWQR